MRFKFARLRFAVLQLQPTTTIGFTFIRLRSPCGRYGQRPRLAPPCCRCGQRPRLAPPFPRSHVPVSPCCSYYASARAFVLPFDVPATAAIRRSFRILQLRLTTTIRVTFTRRWSPGRNCSQQLRPHFNSCVSVSPTTVRFLARTSPFRALTCRLRSFRILQLRLTTT